jgi:tetratricopeptide (TPR) repeat protein
MILNDPGDYAVAKKCYLTAIDIDPKFLMAHYHLANLLSSGKRLKKDGTLVIKKELDRAKKHYIEALRLDPTFPKIHYHIALLLEEEGNLVDAENHLLKAIEINPHYAKAHYRLALLFRNKN